MIPLKSYVRLCIDIGLHINLDFCLMVFEWDEGKNRRNEQKHGISFELAREVFLDPLCFTIADPSSAAEERFWTIGTLPNLVILVVVHTTRFQREQEIIRIISARRATRKERRFYEEME